MAAHQIYMSMTIQVLRHKSINEIHPWDTWSQRADITRAALVSKLAENGIIANVMDSIPRDPTFI